MRKRIPSSPENTSERPLADRLHSVAIHLLRRVRGADRSSGISPARLSVLSVLAFGGPHTLGELADAEQVRPATITGLVEGLCASGLVTKERDARDRRITRVRASQRGEKVLHEARRARVAAMAELVETLPATDQRTIERAVACLESAMRNPQ